MGKEIFFGVGRVSWRQLRNWRLPPGPPLTGKHAVESFRCVSNFTGSFAHCKSKTGKWHACRTTLTDVYLESLLIETFKKKERHDLCSVRSQTLISLTTKHLLHTRQLSLTIHCMQRPRRSAFISPTIIPKCWDSYMGLIQYMILLETNLPNGQLKFQTSVTPIKRETTQAVEHPPRQ